MRALLCIAAVVLATTGCAVVQVPAGFHPTVNIVIDNQYDLRVHVLDQRYGGGVAGARVSVVAPHYGDSDYTNQYGWTRSLAVPPQVDDVKITVEWPVFICQGAEPVWRSVDRPVHLHHSRTDEVVSVDTAPPR